jgi:hypothetical protein
LELLGFDVSLLLDHDATRDAMLVAVSNLVSSATEGDVLVFQYSGHGTTMPNDPNDDDEIDAQDEALCPHDFATGAFIIDDDLADIFAELPVGVNFTAFMDCCFSGTNTRVFFGPTLTATQVGRSYPRFVPPDASLVQAHQEFRRNQGKQRLVRRRRGPDTMRQVSFAASQDNELAWETNGHGDFTTIAAPLLRHVASGFTNEEFFQSVLNGFGANPRQHPELDAAASAQMQLFLQPQARALPSTRVTNGRPGSQSAEINSIAEVLRAFASCIESRSA